LSQRISRRDFLRSLGATALAGTGALLARSSWSADLASADALKLVFYSDVHAREEWGTPEALAMAAEAINAQGADIIIGGGDLITDGFESSAASVAPRWDSYMSFHRALRGEVHTAIGNHDLVAAIPEDGSPPAEDPRSEYRARLGVDRTYYSFDAHGYHFMILDSVQVLGGVQKYQGLIAAQQLAWIREDLASVPPARPIILALHVPLFESHKLQLVLQGHLHVSEMIRWGSTTFITGGALSGKWWRGSWHGTPEGFAVVTLRDGQIDWEYVTYGWKARRPRNA
jgi:Icc protein